MLTIVMFQRSLTDLPMKETCTHNFQGPTEDLELWMMDKKEQQKIQNRPIMTQSVTNIVGMFYILYVIYVISCLAYHCTVYIYVISCLLV